VIARKFDSKAAPYRRFQSDPISLVAAEIHLGQWPAASVPASCTAAFKLRAIWQPRKYRFTSMDYKERREPVGDL
jgi:hypothetical protein